MGFDEGRIILDNENGAYYAGQSVFGKISFDQGKSKTIHGIYVSCKGFCKVHWTTTETRRVNDRSETHTVNHDSFEEYFKTKTFIFGDDSGEHHLQQGHHEFRFECHIPNNCPSSFEGTYGHIRYRVKVVMVTSGIFTMNKEKTADIRIHAPLDLNTNPNCREPIESEIISSYCCWCMSAGSSEIRVKLPVSGYCAGQVIPMEVSVANPSSLEIEQIKFSIRKIVKYEATSSPGTRHEEDKICEMKKGPIPAGASRNWSMEMQVPAMDVYNVNACRFIDMTYYFEVKSSLPSCHEDGEDSHLITFGTVPLVGFQDNIQNPLHDQLPTPIQAPNAQNCYPPPPIMTQPLPNSPYPNGNYPQNTPYPGGPYPTSPNVTPYPPPQLNVSPYPENNPGYPTNSPYPPGPLPQPSPVPGYNGRSPSPVPPYPPATMGTPNPSTNYPSRGPSPVPPYPGSNTTSPYPGSNALPPYPGGTTVPPYPGSSPNGVKTGQFGFVVAGGDPSSIPLLNNGNNVPYSPNPVSSPYAKASAPEPSTPGDDNKNMETYPAYNPEFVRKPE